ncbi:MAG: hypothetical protein LC749_21450 [Actinobacteria bacterium]|nr:hypothetical protein [Actinomycetota bacterium]
MATCLNRRRQAIVECDEARSPDQVRGIESVSRMVYSVMLDTVAELEARNIAVTAGFRNTKQLLAGMLNLSPTRDHRLDPHPTAQPTPSLSYRWELAEHIERTAQSNCVGSRTRSARAAVGAIKRALFSSLPVARSTAC